MNFFITKSIADSLIIISIDIFLSIILNRVIFIKYHKLIIRKKSNLIMSYYANSGRNEDESDDEEGEIRSSESEQ